MSPIVNETLLEERLEALEKSRPWSPRMVSKLETLIRAGDDLALFRINPIAYGAEKGVARAEAIDLFLHAAKDGLFLMDWHLVCPMCGDVVQSLGTLKSVSSHFSCGPCQATFEANLDDFIGVTFTVSPQIRKIAFHDPASLTPQEFVLNYRFSRDARFPSGPKLREFYELRGKLVDRLAPGQTGRYEFDAEPGLLVARNFSDESVGTFISVTDAAPSATASLSVTLADGGWEVPASPLRPGPVTLDITNRSSRPQVIGALNYPPMEPTARPRLAFDPFLSGKELLTTQTFRDLYRSEVIRGTEGLGVKDITFLFTDLKGSTAMYERIGDLKAYALVRQHFDTLGSVVSTHSGAVVKTIGDAVMGTFLHALDGVKAAVGMLREIEAFNRTLPSRDIILKVGLHTGASIAVTLNDRLDYFGQTVNIAARVQGLADADEIYVTDEIYRAPGVREFLGDFDVEPRRANLKGVQQEVQVYRVTLRGGLGAQAAAA